MSPGTGTDDDDDTDPRNRAGVFRMLENTWHFQESSFLSDCVIRYLGGANCGKTKKLLSFTLN